MSATRYWVSERQLPPYMPEPEDVCKIFEPSRNDNYIEVVTAADYAAVEAERDNAVGFIRRKGYHECDIAACNCGSWHDTYLPWRLRFYELVDALRQAGFDTLQLTAQVALTNLVAERDALAVQLAEWAELLKEISMRICCDGPDCAYCESDDDHPLSMAAKMAKQALARWNDGRP